jgi:hypothetical protein
MCGKWLSMNVLMIDEKRVIAERHHTGMLRALERWGFEPIPCDLLHYAPFGGSFHDGARRYLAGARDLTGPERVRIATTAYAETEDHTGRFYDECCRLGPDLRAEQTALYAAYKAWCNNEGALVMSSRAFASRTRELVGLASPKEMILSNQRKHYPGIGLLTDDDQDRRRVLSRRWPDPPGVVCL